MTVLIELPLLALLLGMLFLFIYTLRTGAPSVPTKRPAVRDLVKLAAVKNGVRAVDLGSGDGRLLVALAKEGAAVTGYEINPFLVWWARARLKLAGHSGAVCWRSFWKEDLSQFNLVVLFGIPDIMPKLEQKLAEELKPGTPVISNIFTFPNWQPQKSIGSVHRYIVPRRRGVK